MVAVVLGMLFASSGSYAEDASVHAAVVVLAGPSHATASTARVANAFGDTLIPTSARTDPPRLVMASKSARRAAKGADDAMARLPDYSGGNTQGIFEAGGEQVPLTSGYKGPSAAMPKGSVPGMNNRIRAWVKQGCDV